MTTPNPKRYEIDSIESLINAYCETDNKEAFLTDLTQFLDINLVMKALDETAQMKRFTWIDDGEHNKTINISAHEDV
jgi:hypothetical protein